MSDFFQPITSFFSIPPTRSFAGIKGYVTISENTTDAVELTQQPVQQGASIADHQYKKPITLSIQIQFAGAFLGLIGQSLSQVYQSLLQLQNPVPPNVLAPFTVVTPKRTYNNMLLVTLGVTTDKKTENVLSVSATFQECIIVPLITTNVPISQLSKPAVNGGVNPAGDRSFLKGIVDAGKQLVAGAPK